MVKIGKYTYGTENIKVLWGSQADLTIGNFCSIADNITVFLGGDHAVDWITTFPFGIKNADIFNNIKKSRDRITYKRNNNVTIGNDVWISGGVTIMRGVTIGDGAVIGRNSHVVNDVKPYTVVGGNPAQFYYNRFDEETINKLLELKWWSFNDKDINIILPYLCSNDFDGLFKICKEKKLWT